MAPISVQGSGPDTGGSAPDSGRNADESTQASAYNAGKPGASGASLTKPTGSSAGNGTSTSNRPPSQPASGVVICLITAMMAVNFSM